MNREVQEEREIVFVSEREKEREREREIADDRDKNFKVSCCLPSPESVWQRSLDNLAVGSCWLMQL